MVRYWSDVGSFVTFGQQVPTSRTWFCQNNVLVSEECGGISAVIGHRGSSKGSNGQETGLLILANACTCLSRRFCMPFATQPLSEGSLLSPPHRCQRALVALCEALCGAAARLLGATIFPAFAEYQVVVSLYRFGLAQNRERHGRHVPGSRWHSFGDLRWTFSTSLWPRSRW